MCAIDEAGIPPVHEHAPLPCPNCDYDLAGQMEPYCPECGRSFESQALMLNHPRLLQQRFERLHAADETAARFAGRAAFSATIAFATGLFGIAPALAFVLGFLVYLALSGIGGFIATRAVVRALAWARDDRLTADQRRQLLALVPVLILDYTPMVLALLILVAILLPLVW